MTDSPRIIVALDVAEADAALALADRLSPVDCRLKVGKELFTAAGPELVRSLVGRGYDVFLDLKFHDIPNTVARAVRVAAGLGVWMLNVHASGGRRMMEAAREALETTGEARALLIAVTVLTSFERADLAEIGIDREPARQVLKLAALACDSGLDGVVCSAQEASMLRASFGEEFRLVTPGIRPARTRSDDQRRVVTPGEAVALGSDYLVVGRPITAEADPAAALAAINAELGHL